jgi:hypothetical protein
MVFAALQSFPRMSMQPARHIAFFMGSPQNCPGVSNAADEAEICSRPENYGRNPDPSKHDEWNLALCNQVLKAGPVLAGHYGRAEGKRVLCKLGIYGRDQSAGSS